LRKGSTLFPINNNFIFHNQTLLSSISLPDQIVK
jgi:hypothetical protein